MIYPVLPKKRRRRHTPPARPVRILSPSGSGPHSLTLPSSDDPQIAAFCRLAAEIIVDAVRVSPTIVPEETIAHDPRLN